MPKKTITITKGLTHRPQRSVSDEPPILPQIEVKTVCDTPDQTRLETGQHQARVLLLDIDLCETNGLELLKSMAGQKFDAVLLTDKTARSILALRQCSVHALLECFLPKKELPLVLVASNEHGERSLTIADILFYTTEKHVDKQGQSHTRYLFRMKNGETMTCSNKTLGYYEERLWPCGFVLVSKSYVINMWQVKWYKSKGGSVIMNPYYNAETKRWVEEEILISEDKRKWFKEIFHQSGNRVI